MDGDDDDDPILSFDDDFFPIPLFEELNLEVELRFDFVDEFLFPPVMFTVLPKSGMSKLRSYSWVNYKFVKRFMIFAFSYPFLYTLCNPSK